MTRSAQRLAAVGVLLVCWLLFSAASSGPAAPVAEAAEWRLEQPAPPPPPPGVESTGLPVGLGRIGDIEFWAPNRGLLITAGNPPTIPPGIWAYDGASWHELATVCGATDGHIAWAGPDEFWTISDGRPGQAETEGPPPLADNTLCHFSAGHVEASYGSLAFRPDSYQAMHGAACLGSDDCWFGGDLLPPGQAGAFHLHWDGQSLVAEPNPQGHAMQDMRAFGGFVYESVRLMAGDLITPPESEAEPSVLHLIEPRNVQPTFVSLRPESAGAQILPAYAPEEFPAALDFLHLGSDQSSLWGAANPAEQPPEGSAAGEVTILRYAGGQWNQAIGFSTDPEGGNPFTKFIGAPRESSEARQNEVVKSIAPEPGSEDAWLALGSAANAALGAAAPAMLARVSAGGTVSARQTLPSAQEGQLGIGPKGAADKIACPTVDDCWMATTRGWLFHLTTTEAREAEIDNRDTDPAFAGLITFRPPDQGVPQVQPDAPPPDDSGQLGEAPSAPASLPETASAAEAKATVALVSRLRTRIRNRTTLELRFHLAARARVKLIARRRRRVVASTPARIFAAGNRKLLLRLDPRRWPTKLDLQTHALAALPEASLRGASNGTVSTGVSVLPRTGPLGGPAWLR